MNKSMVMDATIIEMGNGLPDAGDYVPGSCGNLYRIVSMDGRIRTGRPGCGNSVSAKVVLADWDDCGEDDEFPARAELVDYAER
jgi:hypothetical protein